MSLSKKTMLARLQIDMLGMSKKDWQTTKTVNISLNTAYDAGYYQKCRIDRKDVSDIIRISEKARAIHRKLTRPFGEDHWRLLPASRVLEYTKEMRGIRQEFESAIIDLEITWPAIIAKQQKRLGPLFKPEEYPFVEIDSNNPCGYIVDSVGINLSKYYKYDFKLRPTPDSGHIILDLEAETIEELKTKLNKENKKALEESKKELWKRLFEPVKNMADICSNDKRVFKTLIINIKDQLSILSDLNITNDIDLTNMIKDVKKTLTGYTSGQIKDDKNLKEKLGQQATALSDKMAGYMGEK